MRLQPQKRFRWFAVVAAVTLICSLVWLNGQGTSVEARTHEYAGYLRTGDWGQIYDMAPLKERQAQPWDRKQFVTMMRALDVGNRFRSGNIELEPIEGSLTSMRSFTFKLPQDRPGSSMIVSFYRDVDAWRPSLFYVPLSLARLNHTDTASRAKAILVACQSAKIDQLVRLEGPLAMEINRIPDFLAGKIQWENLFHPV